jgi:hypothetical protein
VSSPGGGIEVDFPDETVLIVTPGWWPTVGMWYLNVDVFHTPALEGIMGARAPGSWLPGLPDGTSLGPKPASLHQRYVDLYERFAGAWRVTEKTSLFDYAPGTSTATFTLNSWPQENPPCVIPQTKPVTPLDPREAQEFCRPIVGKNRNANCVFDVRVTGNPGFAKTYLLSQRIEAGSTTTTVSGDKNPTKPGEPVTFTATVARNTIIAAQNEPRRDIRPIGTAQFFLDGEKTGEPVKLDTKGQARWKTSLRIGDHQVGAGYIPSKGTVFLPSSGIDLHHTVRR